MKNADMPAYPIFNSDGLTGDPKLMISNDGEPASCGMSIRQEFAKAAMQGLLSRHPQGYETTAEVAVKYADALLEALEDK